MPDDTPQGPVAAARAAITAIRALDNPDIPRAALDGWCGWGPLAPAFAWSGKPPAWEEIAAELRGRMDAADWNAGRQSTDTAYNTPPGVAAAMWDIITRLGFTGGRALEPGCGAGHLITAAPPSLPVQWTAVEADPVTARVAAARCPHATVHAAPLERVPLHRASFDLVIGNMPFSSSQPWDPAAPDGLALHNYFLWRGLEALRPGGLLIAVTSRHTLDAVKAAPRRELARLGDLIGAVRLPSGTFTGTSAVADLIVMRRRPAAAPPAGDRSWLEPPGWLPGTQLPVRVSRYWEQHPGMVLGDMTARTPGPHGHDVTVTQPATGTIIALAAAADTLTGQAAATGLLYEAATPAAYPADDDDADPAALACDGRYTLHDDGSVTRQQGLRHVPVPAPDDELRLLIRIRDAASGLFAAEADPGVPADDREAARTRARDLYHQYTARYGFLNRCEITEVVRAGVTVIRRDDPSMGGFRDDPGYPDALAIEAWDDDAMTGQPAAILLAAAGVTVPRETVTSNPGDALAQCLDRAGHVDLDMIAGILRTTPDTVPALLTGLIFDDPETGEWVTAGDYLSGDVRAKHAAAVAGGPRYTGHATALATVIPADLPPERITIQLGAAWIPPDVITAFTCHLLGIHPSRAAVAVTYTQVAAAWEVRATTEARKVKAAATLWGTARVNAVDLLEHVLNGTLPAVTDKHPDGTTTRNETETALAADKARAIAERFTEWAWEHPGRATRLGRLYNDRHNSLVARRFNGAHLSFPGMTATFTPWPWQADMTWMAACRPVTLCGHPTGAGKTATATMIALTMRRLGLARKPAYIVPSHLIGQHAAEARRLYPGARILAASQHDLTPARRRGFAARCAAGDWDLILMTHDQFEALPVGPGTEAAHLANITAAIDDAMCAATGKGRAVKQLARRRRVIIARHEELLASGRDTGGVTFEQTRIDYLLYDEAHYAKNLDTITRADGFSSKGSKRATDLLLKLGHLTATSPSGRGGVLFTATFISNSLAELHTLLRFTCPDRLASLGLESFDAFTAAHIQYKTAVEVAPDGSGFRVYRRPWQYCNLAALRELLRDIADIRTKASIQLPGPIVETEHVPVHAEGIRDHSATLVARADAIRRGGVDPATDNMLAICTDGRRAALDPRLAGLPADGPGKIEAVAARTAATYHQLQHTPYPGGGQPGALQMLFCDQGTPGDKGDQAYGWLRDALTAAGVPAAKIAFIHDATTRAEMRHLFAGCRDGSIAVLIGSTAKCGTGANIQPRMAAIHHVDAPWRPADVEQRDGRGNRPGNHNDTLHVYRYVTVGSFDAYMWQALHRKLRWPEQLFAGDADTIDADLPDSLAVLAYSELAAIASGQPLMRELHEVNAELAQARILHAGHVRGQAEITAAIKDLEATAAREDETAGEWHAIRFVYGEVPAGLMSAGRHYEPADAAARLSELATAARDSGQARHLGGWHGTGLQITPQPGQAGKTPAMIITASAAVAWTTPVTLAITTPRAWQPSAARAVLTEIDEWLAAADTHAATAETAAEAARAEAARLREQSGQQSPHAARIRDLGRRRAEIEEAVNGLAERQATAA